MQDLNEQIATYEYLILRIIAKYKLYAERDNYIQIGRLAIWQAIQDFDKSRGNFEMYAYMRIKFAILREFKYQLKVIEQEIVMEEEPLHYFVDTVNGQKQAELERPEWYRLLYMHEQRLIELLFYEGYSIKEVAQIEAVSYDVMKKRRKKVLNKIQAIMEKDAKPTGKFC